MNRKVLKAGLITLLCLATAAQGKTRLSISSEGGIATRPNSTSVFIPATTGRSTLASSVCQYGENICYSIGLGVGTVNGLAARPLATGADGAAVEERRKFSILTTDSVFGLDVTPLTLFKESSRGYPWLNPLLRTRVSLGRYYYSPATVGDESYLQVDAGAYGAYDVGVGFDIAAFKFLSLQLWLGFGYAKYSIGDESLVINATTYGLSFTLKNARFDH